MLIPAIARKAELEQLFAEHIYDDDTGVHMGFLSQYGDWETDYCTLDNVTHWQQITTPKK